MVYSKQTCLLIRPVTCINYMHLLISSRRDVVKEENGLHSTNLSKMSKWHHTSVNLVYHLPLWHFLYIIWLCCELSKSAVRFAPALLEAKLWVFVSALAVEGCRGWSDGRWPMCCQAHLTSLLWLMVSALANGAVLSDAWLKDYQCSPKFI